MDAKLTLKLDKAVIESAKEYAALQKRSLSRIIESYLRSLLLSEDTVTDTVAKEEIEISPFVRSMSTGIKIPTDFDYKSEYTNYLIEKYK